MSINVKIYKTATKKSIMDVTSALNYHKENANGEKVYKGNVVFSITEIENGKYEKAFVGKATIKYVLDSIINHRFHKLFERGFIDYGGSNKNGQVRSRVFTIRYTDRKQYQFTIEEGLGKLGPNGSIQMSKKEKTVTTFVSYDEAVKMALEIYDFINQAEVAAMIAGKPLYTIVPGFNNKDNEQASQNQSYQNQSVANEEVEDFVIPEGKLKGKKVSELDTKALEYIVENLQPDTEMRKQLIHSSKKELEKRN